MTMRATTGMLMALALCACTQEPATADTSAIKQQLQMQEARWNKAYANRDAAALSAMYSDDAALANPGEELARGRAAIDEATRSFASDPNLKVTFSANRIQVAQSRDLAYSRGRYTMTTTNPSTGKPEIGTGHYLTVWQRQPDGSWKAVEDFITPGKALPSQKATAVL